MRKSGNTASQAVICPGKNEPAGKRKRGKTYKGSRWIRRVLREAAQASVRTSYILHAKFNDLIRRRGNKRPVFEDSTIKTLSVQTFLNG
ncbi:MAG: transposase [Deltaproteobacteria bacterium]|nr:transposase [Deltaproteobacteria bacterium]